MKGRSNKRLLLPHEYAGRNPTHPLTVARRRKALPFLPGLLFFPFGGAVWRGIHFTDWVGGVTMGIIVSGFAYGLWHSVITGLASTNHGDFSRTLHPLRFWFTMMVMSLFYLAGVGWMFWRTTN